MIEEMKGNVMDIQGEAWKVLAGSCLDRLLELEDNSIDAVVTDPPYELGFMGKSWDSSGIAYNVEVWRQCLRVLKPGGHVLAFGGSRTWHRLAVAVEDAGFELRDSIAWIYGSGFPKSLDVSKAIDKNNGREFDDIYALGRHIKEQREKLGLSRAEVNAWFGYKSGIQHWEAQDKNNAQPPTQKDYDVLKNRLRLSNDFDNLVARIEAEREVIGIQKGAMAGWNMDGSTKFVDREITIAATPDAKKWQGWGTALKPAFEPVVVGRKPLTGTVAANVLEWGVGGLNIDGTRIGSGQRPTGLKKDGSRSQKTGNEGWDRPWKNDERANRVIGDGELSTSLGRWPSNVMLDEYTASLVDQQSGDRPGMATQNSSPINIYGGNSFHASKTQMPEVRQGYNDSGGASRFFYVAKASKRDRNEGLDGLPERELREGLKRSQPGSFEMFEAKGAIGAARQNFHPTVKPTELMRNLIRLVTPLGGTVLDPFTGSGSTGKAAILEGMQFVGCELTEEYLPIIQGRIDWAVDQVKVEKLAEEQKAAEVLF